MRITILFWLTITSLLVLGCTNPAATPASRESGQVQIAEQLIWSRQHKRAIALLKLHLNLYPTSTDALFFMGQAYFAMGDYNRAADFFRRAASISPPHADAGHRLWAARLQLNYADEAVKKKIRSEIADLLSRSPSNPLDELTAYYGYRYLWDQSNQQRAIRKAATQELPGQLRERVANVLVYEIITTRQRDIRTALSRLYLDHFAGLADDAIAVSWVFNNSAANNNLRQLQADINRYTGLTRSNVAANLYAARALIQNDFQLSTAVSLLRTNLTLIEQHQPESHNKIELARNHWLLGIVFYKQNHFWSARRNFEQALKLQPDNGTAAYFLGKMAESSGNRDRAIKLYRQSLESDGRQVGAQSALIRLLENKADGINPATHFAKKEGVVIFEDVTRSAGLEKVSSHRIAWGDYDNDGDDDLLVDGNRLFSNRDGVFAEVTKVMKIPLIHNATGGIWGDFDNDGYLDIFVTVNGVNRLLKNAGGKRFHDVSTSMLPDGKAANSEAAAWGDFNGDGYLDLYIANYQQPAVERGICSHDELLVNIRGRKMATANHTTLPRPDEAMCGRGVTWGDNGRNGKPDIFVANYRLDPNFLWSNEGNGFTERAASKNIAGSNINGYYGNSIGPVFSDFDNNGELDLFVTNLAHPRDWSFSDKSHLYLKNRGVFRDQTSNSGVGYEETYSDPATADIDNDGDVDLFVSAIYASGQSHLFLNDGKARFRDVSWLSSARLKNTWGSAFSDYDNDGDMDLIVASAAGIRLLKNGGPGGRWIKVSLRSIRCNTFGVGARLEIRYPGHAQSRVITAGRGTGSQDSLTQLFGLGNYQGPVELSLRDGCGHTLERNLPDVDHHYVINY